MIEDAGAPPAWFVVGLVTLPPVILAILLHEIAHGLAALALGDDTARRMGRLSLNPLRHVDPVGTILVPGMLVIGQLLARSSVGFAFGWARPVPVNLLALRDPRRGMMLVAAAGPAMNFLLVWLAALLLHLEGSLAAVLSPNGRALVGEAFGSFILANLMLGLFNLLPVLPLDGGRILAGLLPRPLALPYMRLERWGLLIVLFLLFGLPYLMGGEDPVRWALMVAAEQVYRVILLLSGHGASS